MAKSPNSLTPSWLSLLNPDPETSHRLHTAGPGATRLARCGAGRDAIVMAPLQRGLAALDALDLPVQDGYSVLADRSRQELVVVVEDGWAHLWADTPGVRVLSEDAWLLVPVPGGDGTLAAAWLSTPERDVEDTWRAGDGVPSLGGVSAAVDARALREALAGVDRELAEVPAP
ncbi:hypothetical protein ABT224_19585 [Streptomyces sp. NPDC001584]|uniref:hypothetical protein n=1 Tax=Streptomyces sp. NPDC001584 TaxID=3154521 RepID=UPI0033252643